MAGDDKQHVASGNEKRSSVLRRRNLLQAIGVAGATGLAGCGGGGDGSDGGDGSGGGNQDLGEKVPEIQVLTVTQNIDALRRPISEFIVENAFAPLGIDAYVEAVDINQLSTRIFDEHSFDMLVVRWGASPDRLDPDQILRVFFGPPDNHYNVGQWEHEEYDQLAVEQSQILDPEERKEVVVECQRMLHDLQPVTPIVNHSLWQLVRTDTLSNFEPGIGRGYRHPLALLEAEPAAGSAIRLGEQTKMDVLNPVATVGGTTTMNYLQMIYDTLMKLDRNGNTIEWLMTDVSIEDDTTISGTIRDGVTFHDGTELTAQDVAFTYDYVVEHESPQLGVGKADRVESTEVDGNEITFNLKEPFAPFLSNVLAWVTILPEHIWSDISDPLNVPNEDVIGSGPWAFNSWEPEERMVMDANDDHWYAPNVDQQYRIVYASAESLVEAVVQNDLDAVAYTVPPALATQYRQQVEAGQLENISVETIFQWGRYELRHGFAEGHAGLSRSTAARQAIAHAISFDDINNQFFYGEAALTGDPIVAPEFFDEPTDPLSPSGDIEGARQILADAGFGWDADDKLHYPPGGL